MPKEFSAALKSAADGAEDLDVKAFAKTKEAEIAALLEELKIEFIESHRAFQLVEQVNGWKLVTNPEYGRWVRQLYPESKPTRLSGPALETLAIIAYRQPITRADMEAVRGVAVDGVVQSLLERGLIRIAGRADVPGRPLLYETTEFFLEHFGLRALDELPNSDELRRAALPTAPLAEEPKPAEQMTLGETAQSETPAETVTADTSSEPVEHDSAK
jgi:segregation and condensation protein B